MRSNVVVATFAVLAFGIHNVAAVAFPAPAPQASVPPAPCMGQGDVCTSIGAAQCCGGMICEVLEGTVTGVGVSLGPLSACR